MPRKVKAALKAATKAAPKVEKIESPLPKGELKQFKVLLQLRRRQLLGDVNKLETEALKKTDAGDLSSLPMHMADQGTDNFEQDITLGLMESEGEELQQIQDALDRIADNTFGVCENCKKPIPKPRLKAIPYTRLCLACKKKEEGE
ncbi:MAG TPA: TraR/DksA C4-type zinc finger protein [Planctomycetota bacterium]|nr:TraR/DksA C4-type zinc finger protein [Planctomycetota bacterium]